MKFIQFGRGKWGQNHHRILVTKGHHVTLAELPGHPMLAFYPDRALEMCMAGEFDGAIITCSSVNHWPLVKALYGLIPVFCEKPVCLNTAQLKQLTSLHNYHPLAIFQSGHQLLFLPQVHTLRNKQTRHLVTHRTGAIPRHEGAALSLAVHDIAIAHHIQKPPPCRDPLPPVILQASGNLHNVKAIIAWETLTLELLVQSQAPIRLRSLTAHITNSTTNARNETLYIHPDNWGRLDLLAKSLDSFIDRIKTCTNTGINDTAETIAVMDTTLRLHNEIANQ